MASTLDWDISTVHAEHVKRHFFAFRKTYAMRQKRSFTANAGFNEICVIQQDNRRVTIHEDMRFYDSYRILAISANDLTSVYTDPTFVKLELCDHIDDYSPIQTNVNEQQKKSKFKKLLKKKFKKKNEVNTYISAPFDPLKRCVSDITLTVPTRSDFNGKIYKAEAFEAEKTNEMKSSNEEPFYESVPGSPYFLRGGTAKFATASDVLNSEVNRKTPPLLPQRNASTFYIDKPDGGKGYEIMKSEDNLYNSKEEVDDSYETVSLCSTGSNPYERVGYDRNSVGSHSSQDRLSLHSRSGNGYEDIGRSRHSNSFEDSYDNQPCDSNSSDPKYSDVETIKANINELDHAHLAPMPVLRPSHSSRSEAFPQSRELVTLKTRDNQSIPDSLKDEDTAPYALVDDLSRRRSSTPTNSKKHVYARKQQLSLHLKYNANVYSNCSPHSSRGASPDYENSFFGTSNKPFQEQNYVEDSPYENRLFSENKINNPVQDSFAYEYMLNNKRDVSIPVDGSSTYVNNCFEHSLLKIKQQENSAYENNILKESTLNLHSEHPDYESMQTIYGNLDQPITSSRSKSLKYVDVVLENKPCKNIAAEQTDSSQYNYIKIDFEKSKGVNEAIKDLRLTQQNKDIKGDYLTDLSHKKFNKKPSKKT